MKKIIATMLMLCLILSAVAITASAARETATTLDVPKATTAPVIDGEIDDCWKFAPEVDVVNFGSNIYPQTSTAKADAKHPVAKAKGRLLWDETHLYAIIRVFDPTPNGQPTKENPEDCDYDSVDFQISEFNPDNQPLRDDTVGSDNKFPGNGIFNVNINGKVTGWGGVWYADHGDEKVKGAAKTTDYGYIAEIAIPIQTTTFSEGDSTGFEFQINDNQKGEGRSAIRQWAAAQCLAHSGTKYLGTLNLVAASETEYPYDIFTTAEETTKEQTTTKVDDETTKKVVEDDETTTKAEDKGDETTKKSKGDKKGGNDGLSTGAIIGIIAGAVVVVAAVVVVVILTKKKKK